MSMNSAGGEFAREAAAWAQAVMNKADSEGSGSSMDAVAGGSRRRTSTPPPAPRIPERTPRTREDSTAFDAGGDSDDSGDDEVASPCHAWPTSFQVLLGRSLGS
mmetsp:Transcript_60034/g.173036  ORF Transcript_60034/g.173036 Transcript_60034/m.173036 type:complete len:104 (-) Transcript_60034:150-461(-)